MLSPADARTSVAGKHTDVARRGPHAIGRPFVTSSTRPRLRFRLTMPAELYLNYYQGKAQAVMVETLDGRTLQFPAQVLQRFVTHAGIHGLFEIEFDEQNKFVDIRRVSE